MSRMRSLLVVVVLGGLVGLSSPVSAQTVTERHVSVGTANFTAVPVVTAGADVISPPGLGLGVVGLFVTTGKWAMGGVAARVGLHGRGYGATHPFVVGELGYLAESDCCGGAALAGINAGVTRRRSARSALRFEGRLLLPLSGEGGLITLQIGLTFR